MRLFNLLLLLTACRSDKDGTDDTGEETLPEVSDADGDSFTVEDGDCDDNNSVVNPSAEEICDGVDNNCDGAVDEGTTSTFYADTDGDGFGDSGSPVEACSEPSGTVSVGNDCDDRDADTYPGAPERCDGLDNDCDDTVDEDVTTVWYADADADSYGDPDSAYESCDPPPGYTDSADDCDDLNSSAYPGAAEVCDEVDNDCDDAIDEDVTTTYYKDSDSDSYGLADDTTEACSQPTGYAARAGDCDDSSEDISPNATELCDEADNDCDGDTDEDDAADATTFYADDDADGYGDATDSTEACAAPTGTVTDSTDCDDDEADANPGAAEVCDSIDNDCDGTTDEDEATDAATWYADSDGDGYGSTSSTVACSQPTGFADNSDDCDDAEADANPGESEVCDDIDNDCDGTTDEGLTTTYYADADSDGYGNASFSTEACAAPAGYVSDDTDCDDGEEDANPGGAEVCDSIDNDCDGEADEGVTSTFYADADGDGYGNAGFSTEECSAPSGYVSDDTDCDDGDDGANPGASEVCDEVDNDCDSSVDEGVTTSYYLDSDGDGYGVDSSEEEACSAPSSRYVSVGGDCDDTDTDYSPGEAEGCDGTDHDCDGSIDSDADGDGYSDIDCGGDDCDDGDASVYPEAGGGCALGETCLEILDAGLGSSDGVYTIDPDGYGAGVDPWEVYCDMTTDGGGWTLLARTVKSGLTTAEQDSIRKGTWADYTETGYGDPAASSRIFWLPLEHWHALTDGYPDNEVWIEDSSYDIRLADFTIGDSGSDYEIDWDSTVSGYSGMVSTAIQGQGFTTYDDDNDTWSSNCAVDNVGYNGGWWYTDCYQLSMLHASGNVYSWTTNVSRSVNYLYLYFREL